MTACQMDVVQRKNHCRSSVGVAEREDSRDAAAIEHSPSTFTDNCDEQWIGRQLRIQASTQRKMGRRAVHGELLATELVHVALDKVKLDFSTTALLRRCKLGAQARNSRDLNLSRRQRRWRGLRR